MTQRNADEGTNNGNAFEKNGRRNEPAGRPGPFHLRSSASSADKKSGVSVSFTMVVRDQKANLPHCLCFVAGLIDGARSSTRLQATPRPCREGKCRCESMCFPQTVGKPMPSVLAEGLTRYCQSRSENETALHSERARAGAPGPEAVCRRLAHKHNGPVSQLAVKRFRGPRCARPTQQ